MVWMIIFDNICIKAFGNIFSLLCNVYFDALDESRHKKDKRIELFLYCFLKQFFSYFSGSWTPLSIGRSIYWRPSNCRPSHGVYCRITSHQVKIAVQYNMKSFASYKFILIIVPKKTSSCLFLFCLVCSQLISNIVVYKKCSFHHLFSVNFGQKTL